MTMLTFGTAGIPASTKASGDTVAGLKRIAELGLGGMEIEFVRGVYLKDHTAAPVAYVGKKLGLKLSCHAPYYLNLNHADEVRRRQAGGVLHHAASMAAKAGAKSVVFHAGYYLKDSPEIVYDAIKAQIEVVLDKLQGEGTLVKLRPELAGKISQFGTLAEILRLSKELPGVAPAIDFAHLHASTGRYNSYAEFSEVLNRVGDTLGREALDDLHLHVSGIEYAKTGERRHLNLADSDFHYDELLQALTDVKAGGLLICESPNIEVDTLLLQRTYLDLSPRM
ncbi:deoxyribonuclease IV [Dehalogenimonas formicexedens]|uniref:Deoxyribonuclease IV n=2 Tax=Dehalogenimonas formicexedens TaxID=1839801 RepID=A0A1P8F9S0_9CHLR|nr:deoxyribonuclease IV [Dehalogenimonas formicexedens]